MSSPLPLPTAPADIFFKKTVSLRYGKHTLQFGVSQELFSSHEVDAGTKFLLRTLDGVEIGRKVLDLGCGYGPIGLALRRLDKQRLVHLVDRDALAVAYSQQNAVLNQLNGVVAYGSLGYEAVRERDFDLIASNIPGKMSEGAIGHFLLDGRFYLSANGFMAVVVVDALREMASQILSSAPDVEILLQKPSARYTVFHYRFVGAQRPFAQPQPFAIYQRNRMPVTADGQSFTIETARGLPEFDELGHHTRLLLKAISEDKEAGPQRVLLFNPGQGHLAVAAWRHYRPEQLVLVDRDLLSLYFARHNLRQNGCPDERIVLQHQVGLTLGEGETAERIIGPLRGTEGLKGAEWIVGQGMALLAGNGRLLTAANAHLSSQLALRLPKQIKVLERKKRKGHSALVLAKSP